MRQECKSQENFLKENTYGQKTVSTNGFVSPRIKSRRSIVSTDVGLQQSSKNLGLFGAL